MAIRPLLNIRQSQSLVMTPQLMQSIKLLHMANWELERYINEELEKNPLLEREDFNQEHINTVIEPNSDKNEDNLEALPHIIEPHTLSGEYAEKTYPQNPLKQENQQTNNLPEEWQNKLYNNLYTDIYNIEDVIAEKQNLRHYINEQIVFLSLKKPEKFIAYDLADQLDESGYFTGCLEETATRLNFSQKAIMDIFKKLQQLDPPGIFATSLRDCLALQLQRKNRLDPAIALVLDNLPALAKRDFVFLAKITQLEIGEILDILEEIQQLNPKPGLDFNFDRDGFIVPDVLIQKDNNGCYQAELNRMVLPKLIMHQDYAQKIYTNAEDRDFIGECMQNANWLLRALDQRAKTLLKVSHEIMRHQKEFLDFGISHLKPLNLATVAEAVFLHESTISRVTANKYVATPRGTYEMRSFFSTALSSTSGGESHAAEAVKHRIRQIIEQEDINNVISDDKLVEILKKQKINIARRTVAKYRESMNISSSITRKREKKARYDATKS